MKFSPLLHENIPANYSLLYPTEKRPSTALARCLPWVRASAARVALQRAWHPHEARTLCPRGSAASCALRGSHRRPSRASPPWWDPGGAAAAASCRGERSNGAWAVSSRSPGGSKASGSGGRPQLRHRGARRGQEAGHAHTERPLPRLGPGRDPLGDSGLERLEHVCAVPAGWLGRDQSEEGEERVHGHRRGARRKARP